MKLQPLPELQPITNLSATLFATLKQCPLRAGLRQAKAQQTTRTPKAALLGTLAHRVLEKARSIVGDSEKSREHACQLWDEAVLEIENALRHSPLDKHTLPIQKWRKYFLLRERTLRRCQEIMALQGRYDTQVVARERQFKGVQNGFTGKPDLILRRPTGLVIVDYKSGELPDASLAREEKIASWQQQLLFYAAIVEAECGEQVSSGEIRMLNKTVIPVKIDRQQVEAVAAEAQTLREMYNKKVAAGDAPATFAQYAAEGCSLCEFRGACDTFWKNTPPPKPGTDTYGCLKGQLLQIASVGHRMKSLVIMCEDANSASQRWEITPLSVEQFGTLEELRPGDSVRAIDFAIDADGAFRAKPTQAAVICSPSLKSNSG